MKPRQSLTPRSLLSAWGPLLRGYSPLLWVEITREYPLSCLDCYAYGDGRLGGETTLRQLRNMRGDTLVVTIAVAPFPVE